MKKVNDILKKFVNKLLILFVICPLIVSQGNATTDPITITNEFKMESIYQFDFPFTGNIIDDNFLLVLAQKSILIYDISDIYSIKLLETITTDWVMNCIIKKDSYIYIGGETLQIFKLENNSLELLHENVLINETSKFRNNIKFLDIKDNLLLIAGNHDFIICDLSTGYYPTITLYEFHEYIMSAYIDNVQFSLNYTIYEIKNLYSKRGTVINEFNKTTNIMEIKTRVSDTYDFKYYKDHMYAIYHHLKPYLVQYNIGNIELQYTENYVLLDYFPSEMNLEFYSNYAFIYKLGNMHVYDIENYMIKKIYNHEFDYQYTSGFEHDYTCFRIINNLCFIISPYKSEIFELKFINTMRFGNSFDLILFLAPLLLFGYRCLKKRKSYKIKLNNPRDC